MGDIVLDQLKHACALHKYHVCSVKVKYLSAVRILAMLCCGAIVDHLNVYLLCEHRPI